jgi:hypothetical protein
MVWAHSTLSVKLITTPEPVSPGESFSMNFLLNHNGDGHFVDRSDTIITFDPAYMTIDSLPIMANPWGEMYPCDLEADTLECGGDVWYFPEIVNNKLFFVNSVTGKIKDNTPIGTKIHMSVCMWAIYDDQTANYDHSDYVCDNDHYMTVAEKRVPEFPSALLPVTMIIGFLGAVLLIQRTREH